MGSLTGLLFAALCIYGGGWYMGKWNGNFSLLLFIMTLVTLAYWLAERLHFKPAREAAAANFESQDALRRQQLAKQGIAIIVVSSELPEVLGLSDRVLVMGEGELRGDFAGDGLTQEAILSAALEPTQRAAAVHSNETFEA